jgi:hypothetical protein
VIDILYAVYTDLRPPWRTMRLSNVPVIGDVIIHDYEKYIVVSRFFDDGGLVIVIKLDQEYKKAGGG